MGFDAEAASESGETLGNRAMTATTVDQDADQDAE
jgi:hypothetical protein